MNSSPGSARLVAHGELEGFARSALERCGVPAEDAATVASCLVCANLSGFDSHGVVRLAHYVRRLRNGTLNPRPRIATSRLGPAVAAVDGDDGLGHVVTRAACRYAAEIARESGTAAISIRRSSHFGMAGYYILELVDAGLAAFLTTATDAFLVPHGASRPFFGTNPIAFGFPAPGIPVILDMATTSIPFGKLAIAQKEGRKVPPEWGLDAEGRPCDDPALIRGLHPIAGPKGSGLAMVVDILSSLFAGMAFGPHIVRMYEQMDRPRGLGHFLTVWDVGRFLPREAFVATIGRMIEELRAVPPAPGHDRVYYPGEVEGLSRERRRREGIMLEAGLCRELEELGASLGAPFPEGRPAR